MVEPNEVIVTVAGNLSIVTPWILTAVIWWIAKGWGAAGLRCDRFPSRKVELDCQRSESGGGRENFCNSL